VTINPLKASEIQALLDGDTVLLEYFMGQDNRFIFVVTPKKVLAVLLKVDSSRLFEKIKEFRARAVEGITLDRLFSKAYEKPLLDLYEVLIQPIEEEIFNKKNLVIVPHGMLHYLPFQALLSKEGKYLLESFNISYLPSASVLKYARAKNKGNRVDLFAVGNSATGLSPLPAAEVEVKEVSAIFEKKLVLTGQQATKISVKSQAPQYDMILLSTHGEMIESNPLKSNLRFTPSENDDGKLTVNEIFDMEIKANLVTLSACETGLVRGEGGDFPQGDDLVGLSRAFIHAGAPSVVASLWKVSDDSTVELMRAFYRNLKSMSKSEALRKAQLDLMKSSIRFHVERGSGGITQSINYQPDMSIECSHPYFWAPFILLGDWR
jgi:CHAT domain-containing protein